MADDKKPNMLLYAALLGGSYLIYNEFFSGPPTVAASTAWADPAPATAATGSTATTSLVGAAPVSAPASAPLSTSAGLLSNLPASVAAMLGIQPSTSAAGSSRPGYPLDNDDDIRYGSAVNLVSANSPGGLFNAEWGDGSRNLRVRMARVIGQKYHIFVEELQAALPFRWDQGGFGSWDEMYTSFINNPDSLADVLMAYNQRNPTRQIAPRW